MRIIAVVFALVVMAGCAGGPKVYRTSFDQGAILLLPARDLVQDGKAHAIAAGSGQLLTKKVADYFAGSRFTTIPLSDPRFSHQEVAPLEEALAAGREAGADYCLQLTLGEFRNAAPMTFRSDFVTLEQGALYSTATGEEVWRLKKPIVLEKTNIGNHLGLIDQLAAQVAKSITKG